ncbi:MAG TPA: MltA domain-containing protein [Xanthobacteraceae bacterium]|jgi:membrane-bound lytic murein transglycosylase A|nr:MltA domain-containing protein [Xanthobacteraceae bacterium]
MTLWRGICLLVLVVGLGGVPLATRSPAFGQENGQPIKFPDTQYEPLDWDNLDGWIYDDHEAAFAAYLASCRALNPKQRVSNTRTGQNQKSSQLTEITAALRDVCERAQAALPLDDTGAKKFFEENFRPLHINKIGDTAGFLTGYYEPIIDGSRVPTGEFSAPLYRRPPNLVASGRRKLGDAFPSKGVFVGRRVGRRKIVPYYTRAEIEDGALDGWHLEICYLRDPVDVLFAQIQGSARIRLEDGTILRVNYDSHNGWPYTPVGKVLLDMKAMTKDQVSMQSIRDWMEANPDQAKDVRRANKSYVFFRITDLATEDEAIGAEGVPLMPGRSIAVDHALHTYGMPFFITADLPIAAEKTATKFDRLVVAQDTGSAIVGPARADIYFGAGDEAARTAGRIKNAGDFYMLLPRALDPVEAGRDTPLPPERPSPYSVAATTMEDPTVPDSETTQDVPLPEPRPAIASTAKISAKPKAKAKTRPKQ